MKLTKGEYISRVMTLLNENDVDMPYSSSRVRNYIEELYPITWRRCVEAFPVEWFEGKEYPWGDVIFYVSLNDDGELEEELGIDFSKLDVVARWYNRSGRGGGIAYRIRNWQAIDSEQGIGYLVLPNDFLKLQMLRLRGWKRDCRVMQLGSDEVDFKQSNKYTRGTPYRPICVKRKGEWIGPLEKREEQSGVFVKKKLGEQKFDSLTDFLRFRWNCPVMSVDQLERKRGDVLWYYSVPEDSSIDKHEVIDMRYVGGVSCIPDEQEVSAMLAEPLIYMGGIVTLEGLELWDGAKALEERLGRIMVGSL